MSIADRITEISGRRQITISAAEAEKLFLGRLIQEPAKIIDVMVSSVHFASDNNRMIFESIQGLEARGELIDMLTINQALERETHRSWLSVLGEYANDSYVSSWFVTSQKIILEEFKKREILRITKSLASDFDSDKAIQSLMGIENTEEKHLHTSGEAAVKAIEKAKETAANDGVTGLPTGLIKLDKTIGGFQSPDLYVIGARPAMGKTSVILNFMLNHNAPIGFFSTEQPAEQIGLRAISAESNVSARKIRVADFSDQEYESMAYAVTKLASKNIYIYDKSYLTITELMREARRLKYNHDVKAIYVDYIQRVKADSENRRLEVAEVVTGLKSLARELQIPVIALAQVNRQVENRADRRPHMGDLLESGVIEQEADVVMLLYRDEVYNEDSPDQGVIEILIDKNRHGVTGKLRFAWLGETMQIKNLMFEGLGQSEMVR